MDNHKRSIYVLTAAAFTVATQSPARKTRVERVNEDFMTMYKMGKFLDYVRFIRLTRRPKLLPLCP
jgi:hypothetical protein